MLTVILLIIGTILSILGTVLKIQFPVIPGLWSLSIFTIGIFVLGAGLSSWFRAIDDMIGPFYLSMVVAVVSGMTVLVVDRILRVYFSLDLLDELLKFIPIKWPFG